MQRSLVASLTRAARSNRSLTSFSRTPVSKNVFASASSNFVRFQSNEAKKTQEPNEQPESEAKMEENTNSTESPEVTELKAKLQQKDKDLADMKNHYARAVADFRNLQESTKKEIQKSKDFALQKFAKDLLESIDNFNLALTAVTEEVLQKNSEVKNLYEGVSMTRNVFEKTLSKHGIEKIDPIDQEFDPNLHEAVFEIPQPEKKAGTVFHVQQPGYTLNTRVLRPAKVGLVKDVEN